MKIKIESDGLARDISRYRLTSSEGVRLDSARSHTSASSSGKESISVLIQVMLSLLEVPRKCSDAWLEVTLKGKNVWRCFSGDMSYWCDTAEPKDTSFTRNGAGKYHSCVRCEVNFKDMVHGRRTPNRLLASKTET